MRGSEIIPDLFESYATVRVVWYSKGASVTTNLQSQSMSDVVSDSASFRVANGITVSNGGVELSTNGESDIAGLSWNKDTESPAGVLSMSLFPRQDYANRISVGDVLLVWGKADKRSEERFIALVSIDSVAESRNVTGNGATVLRISVMGRDLGKILMETPTVYDAAWGGFTMAKFFTLFTNSFTYGAVIGGPGVVVQSLLNAFFALNQNFVTEAIGAELTAESATNPALIPLKPWRFPGQTDLPLTAFIDINSFVQTPMVGNLDEKAGNFTVTLLQNAANLWSLCEMYSNRVVNEFFIDTRDLVPGYDTAQKRMAYYAQQHLAKYADPRAATDISASEQLAAGFDISAVDADLATLDEKPYDTTIALVHRQLPYDTYSFYALPTNIVYETECYSDETGFSEHDVQNFFRMRLPGLVEQAIQDLQFGTVINRESIERHGIRRYEGESIYFWTGQGLSKAYEPTFKFYMGLVTTWHAFNERLRSGSLSIRFRPDIRVGTRLTYLKTNTSGNLVVVDYYIQRVSHSWSPNPGSSRTTLDLVRGIQRDGVDVTPYQESHLFWTDEGGSLDPNPYEIVISEDVMIPLDNVTVIPASNVEPK